MFRNWLRLGRRNGSSPPSNCSPAFPPWSWVSSRSSSWPRCCKKFFGYESRLNAFVAGHRAGAGDHPGGFLHRRGRADQRAAQLHAGGAGARFRPAGRPRGKSFLPAAIPGVFAAVVLGFGRAIGETMIVLMASGNASIVSGSFFDSTRTMTATIAAELAETVTGGHHYRILFLIGALLFIVTFAANFRRRHGHAPVEAQAGGQGMSDGASLQPLLTRPAVIFGRTVLMQAHFFSAG